MEALVFARSMPQAMSVSASAQVAVQQPGWSEQCAVRSTCRGVARTAWPGRVAMGSRSVVSVVNPPVRERGNVECAGGLGDFVGGDLLGFDLDDWVADVENYGSLAVYAPPEGGYEGRYITRLKGMGYHFMEISARGLGDPESYLTKVHGVRPPHLGKQAIVRWYFPPEVDYRLSLLPKNAKGLVLWVLEAKVLSKSELQYLALLPAIRPDVKVIAECGSWRKYRWKPLKDVAGIPASSVLEK